MKKFFSACFYAALAIGAAFVSSCTDPNTDRNDDDNPQPTVNGTSVKVPNVADTTVAFDVEFEADWRVSNQSSWFAVTPLSGKAGTARITITVLDTNSELTEKVSNFLVLAGEESIQYYVIQDVVPGFNVTNKTASVAESASEYAFPVEGNLEYEATTDADWITINGVEYDSTLLADQTTYSKYMTSRVNMSIAENTGDVRTAEIVLTASNGMTETLTVNQMGELVADYTKEFFRHTFMVKHTATWCGPCGTSSTYIHQVEQNRPGRLLWAGFYQSSDYGLSAWNDARTYFATTGSSGIPTMVWNNYAQFAGAYQASVMTSLVDEATNNVKSQAVLGGRASIENGNVVVYLSVASKVSSDYKVSVFLLEDGLRYSQSGVSGTYTHNNVVRGEFTAMWGESLNVPANSIQEKTFTMAIPASVENQENLHVYAVLYRDGTYSGSVAVAEYKSANNTIVDNAVDIRVNSFTVFKYEE